MAYIFHKNNIKRESLWLIFICIMIFFIRLPDSAKTVIHGDESVCFVLAQDIVGGGVLYQTSWSNKGPLIYFTLAAIIMIFGDNILALHIFTSLYLIASMYFLYLISRKLFRQYACLIPPLVYGLFFSLSRFQGMASNGEFFMMFPVIIATYYFILFIESKGNSLNKLFLCGLFSWIAVQMKAPAFCSILLFPAILVIKKYILRSHTFGQFCKEIGYFVLGAVLVEIMIVGYFSFKGAAADYFYSCYVYNFIYINSISIMEGLNNMAHFFLDTARHDAISILAFGSTLFLCFTPTMSKRDRCIFFGMLGLAIFSLVGVYAGKNMYLHYYLQMGFPFSLLIGFAVSKIAIEPKELAKIIFLAIMTIFLSTVPFYEILIFPKIIKMQKNDVYHEIAKHIADHTKEKETIFVLGGQPIIYFLAKRKSPIKYFYWLPHYGLRGDILNIKNSTLTTFTNNKPVYFVYDSEEKRKIVHLERFMQENYYIEKQFGSYLLYRANK